MRFTRMASPRRCGYIHKQTQPRRPSHTLTPSNPFSSSSCPTTTRSTKLQQHQAVSVRTKRVSLADLQATFSLTSTLETRKFREDLGRKYQAFNDEYSVRVSGGARLTSAPRGREGARREYTCRTQADEDSDSTCSTRPSKLYVRRPCRHSLCSRMATSTTSHPSIRCSATMARALGLSTSAAARRLGFPRWPTNFQRQNGM
jgi:hypothetical protein